MTLSGSPATGDFVFPYSYNSANGQLTVTQNGTQQLNVAQATALINGSGNVYLLDNEPISTTVNGTTVSSQSQILPYTIGNNGALQAQIGGAVPDDPSQSNPIQLLVESKGTFIYVANVGNNNTTTGYAQSGITGYILTTSPFKMTEIAGLSFGTGAGPQCIVEDPSNQFIYTANHNDATVTGKVLNVETGTLQDLPKASSFPLSGPASWCLMNGRTD